MKQRIVISTLGAAMLGPLAFTAPAQAQGVEFRLGPNGVTIDNDRERRERREMRREMQERRAYEDGRREERRRQRWEERTERGW